MFAPFYGVPINLMIKGCVAPSLMISSKWGDIGFSTRLFSIKMSPIFKPHLMIRGLMDGWHNIDMSAISWVVIPPPMSTGSTSLLPLTGNFPYNFVDATESKSKQ